MIAALPLLLSASLLLPPDRITNEEASRRVDTILSEWKVAGAPGLVAAVVRDGVVAHRGAVGVARAGEEAPLDSSTPFYIASVSKQFTAACVHLLALAGRLSLDEDVRALVPELRSLPQSVTVRQLLHHRSGIRDFYELLIARGEDLDALADPKPILDLLARQKELCFEPGTRFLYSNSGYLILGEIVRRASGKPLAAFAAENLFAKIGMKDSRFRDDASAVVPGLASGHELAGDRQVPREGRFALVGPGGVVTTLEDLLLWDRSLDARTLGGPLVDALQAPAPLRPDDVVDAAIGPYASGLFVGRYRGHRTVRHSGGSFGYKAEFLRLPDDRLTVIVLANASRVEATGIAERIADVYLGESGEEPAPPSAPPLAEFRAFAGAYHDPASHRTWVLTQKDDHVKAVTLGTPPIRLRPAGPRLLRSTGTPVTSDFRFEEGGGDRPARLFVTVDGKADGSFGARKIAPLSADDASALAGSYRCDEIDATVVFEAAGARLAWASPKPSLPIPPFVSIGGDVLISDAGAQVEFERDAQGRVTGGRLSLNRAWGLRLVKR